MAVIWDGAFASTDLPAGQRISGWSENTTGAGALKTRYRDGDPLSAFAWREMYGNVNFHVASSARMVWTDNFNAVAGADPSKLYTGTDFTAAGAIYAVTPAMFLTPNPTRGDQAPPRLSCRVRARKNANGTDAIVRIYTAPTLSAAVEGWADTQANSPATAYATWTINSTTYPATPGWSSTQFISAPAFSERTYAYPVAAGLDDVMTWVTYLVLACKGNADGSGLYVAAVEVMEEAPGA